MSKIYVGDIGTEIIAETGEDLSTATTTTIRVTKPDRTVVEWTGTVSDLTSIKYVVINGDLNLTGTYKCQAYVVLPAWQGLGETFTFKVYAVFK